MAPAVLIPGYREKRWSGVGDPFNVDTQGVGRVGGAQELGRQAKRVGHSPHLAPRGRLGGGDWLRQAEGSVRSDPGGSPTRGPIGQPLRRYLIQVVSAQARA